jgi:hypothetical protein
VHTGSPTAECCNNASNLAASPGTASVFGTNGRLDIDGMFYLSSA